MPVHRICKCPSCTKYAEEDSKYCINHKHLEPQPYDWRNRQGHFNYQDSNWRKLSSELKKKYPVCQKCGLYPSEEVHHIVAIRDGGDPYDEDNLICLCHKCHTAVTNQEIADRNKKKHKIKELMKRYGISKEEAEGMINE